MMKFCSKCGNELFDEAIFCSKCGCAVEKENTKNTDKFFGKIKPKYYMILGSVSLIITIIIFIKVYMENNETYQYLKIYYPNMLYRVHHPFYYGMTNVIKSPFFYIAIVSFILGIIALNKEKENKM